MTTEVMIDLETLGTEPGAPILSIGACAFGFDDSPIADTFYRAVDLESCLQFGMRPSALTIKWWMQQEVAARDRAFSDVEAVPLAVALCDFSAWYNGRDLDVWGNSARFDLGLLEAAYKLCAFNVPWKFWQERCYRTAKSLPGARAVPLERIGTHHNALDDAVSQAMHLRGIYRVLGLSASPMPSDTATVQS
jgi:hypothetical protein